MTNHANGIAFLMLGVILKLIVKRVRSATLPTKGGPQVAFSNIDRTKEVESKVGEIIINSTDHCHYYERHPDTFLNRKECWTCIYSEFGISSGNPSDTGFCEYNKGRKRNRHNPIKLSKEPKQ
jgi:hypothetical protein